MQQIFLNIFFYTFGQILRYVFSLNLWCLHKKGQYLGQYPENLKNSFYCLKSIYKVLVTICNQQNQNRPIRTGDTACHMCATSFAGPMTSRDVIGLPPVTISLVTLYNYSFLTVEDYTKDAQEISCDQLPCRRRKRRMFVIYSSAYQLCFIANYLGT